MCGMEYIYFARPDSVIEGQNVHSVRKETGRQLARKDQDLNADIVIGVPDSSLSAAMGYAEEADIPLETGLVKTDLSPVRLFSQLSRCVIVEFE